MLKFHNFILLREKSSAANTLYRVFVWASKNTAEASDFALKDYFMPPPIKRVLFRLSNTQRGLYGIRGLQGTGKSTALKALAESLPDKSIISYKWNREWRKSFEDEVADDTYWLILWDRVLLIENIETKLHIAKFVIKDLLRQWRSASNEAPNVTEADIKSLNFKMSPRSQISNELDKIADTGQLEALLGERVTKEIKQRLLTQLLQKADYIFIDLPDYNKSNVQLMNKDVDELQHMWSEFMEDERKKVTFLISAQKEILMKHQHFFFGKIMWEELKPLTPKQLLEAYKQKWESYAPFTEDSLAMVAKLCRGVFRRFLRYICLVIENYNANGRSGLITIEDVRTAISFDVLQNDMELELADVFTNSGQRTEAIKILDLLRESSLTQKQIAETTGISEPTVGRLVQKLELYGYVKRSRVSEGNVWSVSLV